jgi:hypothetical protein
VENLVTRVNLDAAPPQVRRFIQNLPIGTGRVELTVDGGVICVVVPPSERTPAEREELIRERLRLMRKAQRRNKGVPAKVIERKVQDAIDEVRRRKRT